MTWRTPGVLALVATTLLATSMAGSAQGAPYCEPDQLPRFVFGFAALKEQIGDVMGEPMECEHANPRNGDALQQTTTGLSFYRKQTNTPTFTDGWEHWALTAEGLVTWLGDSIDPPGLEIGTEPGAPPPDEAPAPAPPTPVPTVTPRPLTRYRSVQQPGWTTPLEVPVGFTVEEVASGLQTPRFMALDTDGSLVYGSHTTDSVVRLRDLDRDGRFETRQLITSNLTFVHSVAFVNGELFAAGEREVVKLSNFGPDGRAGLRQVVLGDLPAGATDLYGHRTRTLLAGADGKLYLSVGSSCDVCDETTPLRAAVLRFNADGSGLEVFASGLRNSVGIAIQPTTGLLWGVDMGRNNIGPGLPPDELNLIEQGKQYGWPACFGDRQPDPIYQDPARCATTEAPRWTFPAHWSPLGLAFYSGTALPAEYRGDLLVASHGSAADQTGELRVGYVVSRLQFQDGQPVAQEDFLRGFTIGGSAWGRPTGLLVAPDGSVLVSDDFGGRIFRVRYVGAP